MILTLAEWQKTKKNINDLILQASVKDGSDSWTPFPIGFCWQYVKETDKVKIQFGSHDNLVLCAINDKTDLIRRPHGINRKLILRNLEENGIYNSSLESKNYFSSLSSYKFVVSPEGNGIDCHRHYEALMAGCIPIMEYNSQIEDKYKGLPILYTKDYSEINSEYLNNKYNEIINKEYDFSRLILSYYNEKQQKTIKEYEQYWLTRLFPQVRPDIYFNSIFGKPIVWITLINYGYIEYTKNFLKSMEKNNCSFKLIVYCLDKEIIEELSEYKNAICFDASFIKESTQSNLTEWFSTDYRKIVFSKLDAIKYTINICNRYGIWSVGYIDTDIIVFKDPTQIILDNMNYNHDTLIFSQCDEDSRECSNPSGCPHICTGVIVFRTGSIDTSIFDYSSEDLIKYNSDQDYLVDILRKKQIKRLTISKNIFLNGAYPGVKNGSLILPPSACLLHYNYMNGNEKQNCMKKNGMWYL